jgi:hypothetical protein
MKHSHVAIDQLNLVDMIDFNRSDLLGTLEQQQDRMVRLFWLAREMPKVPLPPTSLPQYTFHDIFEFEAGLRDLHIELLRHKIYERK